MQFRHNEDNPLEAEAIVVDEASMLDPFLAHSFVKAIPAHAQVLIVGDIDQLPSVVPVWFYAISLPRSRFQLSA